MCDPDRLHRYDRLSRLYTRLDVSISHATDFNPFSYAHTSRSMKTSTIPGTHTVECKEEHIQESAFVPSPPLLLASIVKNSRHREDASSVHGI